MAQVTALSLVFAGCCSNVFTLEAIVKNEPGAGLLITVSQFLLTTLFSLPSQLERRPISLDSPSFASFPWQIRYPKIPLERLALLGLMFFTVNMLNNWAFAFHITVPMHIILRSFGSVTTLAVGWCAGRRYSRVQVGAVAALTVGIVVSAWADASAKGTIKNKSTDPSKAAASDTHSFAAGLAILFAAQLLSAIMGVYAETTYAKHGRHWVENLFYTHVFSLLFSFAFWPTLSSQFSRLLTGPPASFELPESVSSYLPPSILKSYNDFLVRLSRLLPPNLSPSNDATNTNTLPITKSAALLALNALTQVACISGVNLLSTQVAAVGVTIVLNVRKLVSFLLSCLLFGNPLTGTLALGAAIVFASGAVYGLDAAGVWRSRKAVDGSGSRLKVGKGNESSSRGGNGVVREDKKSN